MDDVLKRIGAGILGALEGVGVVALIAVISFAAEGTKGAVFSLPVGWSVFGGILGAVICFCYPVASVAIFIGLAFIVKTMGVRNNR